MGSCKLEKHLWVRQTPVGGIWPSQIWMWIELNTYILDMWGETQTASSLHPFTNWAGIFFRTSIWCRKTRERRENAEKHEFFAQRFCVSTRSLAQSRLPKRQGLTKRWNGSQKSTLTVSMNLSSQVGALDCWQKQAHNEQTYIQFTKGQAVIYPDMRQG